MTGISKTLVVLMLVSFQAHAQMTAKGEWKFPTDARSYCLNLEQNIVNTYKSMVENNRLLTQEGTGDRRSTIEMGGLLEKAVKGFEESWQRMDCASILYGKK